MALTSGTKLGPYEIQSPLGAGGMGEVYRALDTRLDRIVAVKILPAHFSNDPVHKLRFEREAKSISSLNHPNICTLHDVGSQDGVEYLVMELVEGESLSQRLEKGPLPVDQVLKIGAEIANALDRAHRSGVVHRDLKPGNIMLTKSGAKLLDFGLALTTSPIASLATMTATTPKQSPLTQEGMIVGTFQYMSPEQVEGKELDARSDIFSLGAVLYEMLTGKRAFEGKSQLGVASAILEKDPAPISSVKPLTPPNLDRTVRRCLAKDPEDRWQCAKDLASELKWTGESAVVQGEAQPIAAASKTRETIAWVCATALGLLLIAGAMWWRNSKPIEQAMHFSAPFTYPVRDVSVSPNGRTVAVATYRESLGKNVLWIYEPGSLDARMLADTEGAAFPFWSADGHSLGFFADGKLKRLDIAGGPIQTLCDAPTGRGGTWNKDGVIIFTPSGHLGEGLYRIQASGGTPVQISAPDKEREEDSDRWPMFLPDGLHYLYLAMNLSGKASHYAIYAGSLGSNEKKLVVHATANAAYAEPGYLVFYRDKTLFAQPFDAKKLELTGEASAVLTDIQYNPRIAKAGFGVSSSGVLVAQRGNAEAISQPLWFDRNGKELGAMGEPGVFASMFLSPDGKSVALDKTDPGNLNTDVWTYDLLRGSAKRLTFDPAIDSMSVWSPDSRRVVFASNRLLTFDLYLKNADGAEEEKVIVQDGPDKFPNDWSKDGKNILYSRGNDLWVLNVADMKSSLFLKAPATMKTSRFSPDGKWVAYASNETGKWEIYVTSFPEPHGKWEVSSGGGTQPRWRGDGKELFYLSSDAKMMGVTVTTGANFDVATPVTLFKANPREEVATSEQFMYDVASDGQRFLINTQIKQTDAQPLSVVLNWTAGLKQ